MKYPACPEFLGLGGIFFAGFAWGAVVAAGGAFAVRLLCTGGCCGGRATGRRSINLFCRLSRSSAHEGLRPVQMRLRFLVPGKGMI